MKNFDEWNILKKSIDFSKTHKFYHEREVWWCSIGKNVGFEQDGSGERSLRPILVLKGFSKQVCIVLPLTTSSRQNPYYINIGEISSRNSFVIISQIKLIDTKRLVEKIGFLNKETFATIRKTVRDLF